MYNLDTGDHVISSKGKGIVKSFDDKYVTIDCDGKLLRIKRDEISDVLFDASVDKLNSAERYIAKNFQKVIELRKTNLIIESILKKSSTSEISKSSKKWIALLQVMVIELANQNHKLSTSVVKDNIYTYYGTKTIPEKKLDIPTVEIVNNKPGLLQKLKELLKKR